MFVGCTILPYFPHIKACHQGFRAAGGEPPAFRQDRRIAISAVSPLIAKREPQADDDSAVPG